MFDMSVSVQSTSSIRDEGVAESILHSLDERSLSASLVLSGRARTIEALVLEGTRFIEQMAFLPIDAEADAMFDEHQKSFGVRIPKRVIKRK